MKELTVADFEPIKKRFLDLVDEGTFKKECSFALQHLKRNAYLSKSTPDSLLIAVLNIAQVGLTLNPVMKLAYLVPRFDRKEGVVCHLEPSYQGLVKLLTDSGSVNNVYAHLIYENDHFEQHLGTENTIVHRPKLGDRGKVMGVYAVAVLANGTKQTEVMEASEVDEIRDSSESYKAFVAKKTNSCIWEKHYDEMSRKTVIKRLVKYLPKTNFEKLAKAIDLDNDDHQISYGQIDLIDNLLFTSTMPEERKEFIDKNLNTMSRSDATTLITELKENQVDVINGGIGHSQTQISEKLKKEVE